MDLTTLLLVGLTAAVSGGSRGWRWQTPPWGAAVIAAAAVVGQPPAVLAVLAVVAASVEVLGRPAEAPEVVPALLAVASLGIVLPRPEGDAELVAQLGLLLAAAVAGAAAIRIMLPLRRRPEFDPWSHAGAAVGLLASAVLIAKGLLESDSAVWAVGGAAPLAVPLLISRLQQRSRRSFRLQALSEMAETLAAAAAPSHGGDLEEAVRQLHSSLAPVLGHRLTVLALHPLIRLRGPTLAAHPIAPAELPLLSERVNGLFARRRRADRSGPTVVTPEQARSLHPDYPFQLIVPIARGNQRLGFACLLGDDRRITGADRRHLASALGAAVRHLVEVADLAERVELLGQRAQQQRDRLRSLLALHRLVVTASDLNAVCCSLMQAVTQAFMLPGCSVLMCTGHGTWRTVVDTYTGAGDAQLEVMGSTLEAALALGRPVSRCRVLARENWPLPLPTGDGVPYLLALPLEINGELLAVLTANPAPGEPLPDLDELRLLELFVEQTAPVLQSALHLEEVQRQTMLDGLTGVANRRALDYAVEHAVRQARERGTRFSVAMVDIDDFKSVNDRYGHGVGDLVLKQVARLLGQSLRSHDLVGRYGGEEFCIVLPDQAIARAAAVLERLREAVATANFADEELPQAVRLTVSIGCATYPEDGAGAKAVIERADVALYRAKRTGKNRLVCADDLTNPGLADREEPFAF